MSKKYIFDRLMAEIHNPYGVCGLMGNLQAESNFRPKNMQNSYEATTGYNDETYTEAVDNNTYHKFQTDRIGFGIAQWTSEGRKTCMWIRSKETGKSIGDLDFQIDFIIWEMVNGYTSVLNTLKNATSVREASDIVTLKYEAPGSVGKNATEEQRQATLDLRASYGEKLYKELVGEKVKEETKEEVKEEVKQEVSSNTSSNSPLVDYVRISPNSSNPRNKKITKITIHHMAGDLTVERCGELFANTSRQASSNYSIGTDGRVGMYVEEKNRAWTSGNRENDNMAVTIEVANDGGEPNWHVSDKALAKLIDLCTDICKRNGIEKLVYTGNKSGNLTMHKWFQATTCPGPYLESKFPYIAEQVNKRLGAVEETTPKKIYRVQVGAFSVKANAEKLANELKSKGYDAIIV